MTVAKAIKQPSTLVILLPGLFVWLILSLLTTQAQMAPSTTEEITSSPFCAPLPPPEGEVIQVTPAQDRELDDIIAGAASGDTILLADGTYELEGDYLYVTTPGVTVRSASGNREAVILDGGYQTTEIFLIAASDVTIADLNVRRAYYHPIHVTAGAEGDTENTLIYNVRVLDPGQQAIKINANGARTYFADNGMVACSHIELTDGGRLKIWEINGSCYTGGVDAHRAEGWVVRDNLISGFWCDNGLSEHAIHFWSGSKDTLVARNRLIDNARGIGFGLGESGDWRTYAGHACGAVNIGHYDGIIRNNFIFQGRADLYGSQNSFECGVCLEQACGTKVFHNSVVANAAAGIIGGGVAFRQHQRRNPEQFIEP